MKKILLIALTLCIMLTFASCNSGVDDDFHYDLINKYQNTDGNLYYKDTVGGVQIEDFGVKYKAVLYDIEASNDNELAYYYKYEGTAENTKGNGDMDNYLKYLTEAFEVTETQTGMWCYKINSDGDEVRVSYYQLSGNAGLIVVVCVPTEGVVGEDKNINFIYKSDSTSDNTASSGN